MNLSARATIQIQKTAEEVYEGIVDHEKLTKYFISGSSGRLETGHDVSWEFAEFPGSFPVTKVTTDPHRSISFVWDEETVVDISLESQPDHSTVVKVVESGKKFSDANLAWVIGNTEGWANFLACLKAYLEYGVRLRKGAFDYIKKDKTPR